uniref:Uncharacterized protein n=1 Tax=Anopheles atroparvus TaxID=41427 RepID=A0A182J8R0_ANOAO
MGSTTTELSSVLKRNESQTATYAKPTANLVGNPAAVAQMDEPPWVPVAAVVAAVAAPIGEIRSGEICSDAMKENHTGKQTAATAPPKPPFGTCLSPWKTRRTVHAARAFSLALADFDQSL